MRYLRERERLLGAGPRVDAGTKKQLKSAKGGDELEAVEVEEEGRERDGEKKEGEQMGMKEQKVYVLDRGFVGWQERFGEDARLTEGYSKELWKDGYWM